jgi:hypothetical protein
VGPLILAAARRFSRGNHHRSAQRRLATGCRDGTVRFWDPRTLETEVDVDKVEVVTAPAATNPNLAAQKGLFTLVRRVSSAEYLRREPMDHTIHERMARTFGKGGGPEHALIMYFLLPVEEAPALLTLLARDGVTAAEVFPGYGGVVQALKERNLWVDHNRSEAVEVGERISSAVKPARTRG